MTVARELPKYKLDLMGVQEVRWDRGGTKPVGEYTFFYEKGHENHDLVTDFFVQKRIISAVERVDFFIDRISSITSRGRWSDIIVLNAHIPTQDKIDDIKDSWYEEMERVFDKFLKHHMKMLLEDFSAKVGREYIFKPTIGNENLREISNDNRVGVVNFATSKNVTVKSTMFPHRNIHKFTCTSSNGKTHNQIEYILIDRKRHSSIHVRSFRAADCRTDYHLVGTVRETGKE
jgi:hypothetical protein